MIKTKIITGRKIIDHFSADADRVEKINNYYGSSTLAEKFKLRQIETNVNDVLTYNYQLVVAGKELPFNSADEIRGLISFLEDSVNVVQKNPPSEADEKTRAILMK